MVQEETIRISGPVLTLSGTADFNHNGELTVLNFPSVRMGPLNDLSFQLSRGQNGDDYLLRGRSLDGSKIGRTGSNEAPGGGRAAARPTTRLPAASISTPGWTGWPCATMFPSRRSIWSWPPSATGPRALTLSGNVAQGTRSAPIAANLENSAAGRKVTVTSGDAGLLARGLFAFESMRGGELTATINLPGQASDTAQSQCAGRFHRHADGEEFPAGQPAA